MTSLIKVVSKYNRIDINIDNANHGKGLLSVLEKLLNYVKVSECLSVERCTIVENSLSLEGMNISQSIDEWRTYPYQSTFTYGYRIAIDTRMIIAHSLVNILNSQNSVMIMKDKLIRRPSDTIVNEYEVLGITVPITLNPIDSEKSMLVLSSREWLHICLISCLDIGYVRDSYGKQGKEGKGSIEHSQMDNKETRANPIGTRTRGYQACTDIEYVHIPTLTWNVVLLAVRNVKSIRHTLRGREAMITCTQNEETEEEETEPNPNGDNYPNVQYEDDDFSEENGGENDE